MKKHINLTFSLRLWLFSLIFFLLAPSVNTSVLAQKISPDTTPNLQGATILGSSQGSPFQDIYQLIPDYIRAIGTLLSGVIAVAAFINTESHKKNVEQKNEITEITENRIKSCLDAFIQDVLNQMIKNAPDEHEIKMLLEKKKFFEEQLKNLRQRSENSQNARRWLISHRETLADQAVAHALGNESVPQDVRDTFRLGINQYLFGVQECLNIGRRDLLDKLEIKHVLPSSFYKKALEFILDEKALRNLSSDEIVEMKIYFDYIIGNLP